MQKLIIPTLLLTISLPLIAETVYINGQPCFVTGNQVTCPNSADMHSGGVDQDAMARMAETRRQQQQARSLDECLRKADWPGAPSRSECERIYGQ